MRHLNDAQAEPPVAATQARVMRAVRLQADQQVDLVQRLHLVQFPAQQLAQRPVAAVAVRS